jgi:hypothetical protein
LRLPRTLARGSCAVARVGAYPIIASASIPSMYVGSISAVICTMLVPANQAVF